MYVGANAYQTTGDKVTDEALRNKGYVEHINKNQEVPFTYEELKSMGLPTHITKEGFITWD
jgi:hypothetical protein